MKILSPIYMNFLKALLLILTAASPLSLFAEISADEVYIKWYSNPPELNYIAQKKFRLYPIAFYLYGYFSEDFPALITGNSTGHKSQTPRIKVFVWDCAEKVDAMYSWIIGDVFLTNQQRNLINDCKDYNKSITEQLQSFQQGANSHNNIKKTLKQLEDRVDEHRIRIFRHHQSIVEKKTLSGLFKRFL